MIVKVDETWSFSGRICCSANISCGSGRITFCQYTGVVYACGNDCSVHRLLLVHVHCGILTLTRKIYSHIRLCVVTVYQVHSALICACVKKYARNVVTVYSTFQSSSVMTLEFMLVVMNAHQSDGSIALFDYAYVQWRGN